MKFPKTAVTSYIKKADIERYNVCFFVFFKQKKVPVRRRPYGEGDEYKK